jgi:hypothetical protein
MEHMSRDHLKAVTYLDVSVVGDWTVNLMPFWDAERWHLWVQGPAGLIDMRPLEAMHVDYVAKAPAKESDLFISFVDVMWQRASWPEICPLIGAICDDFHNMGTSVAKLRHIFRSRETIGDATPGFVSTEIEYLLILARTVFDLVQEAISRIWKNRIQLLDPRAEERRRAKALPETFSRIVLRNKTDLRTAGEIESDFGLPPNLAVAYASHGDFFAQLRDMRDRIVHGGKRVGHVFDTPRGFCVEPTEMPFRLYSGWTEAHRYNENLVSLLPWLSWVVLRTIAACNLLVGELGRVIVLPPEIAPGYRVFVRGPSNAALLEMLRIEEGGTAWWDFSETEVAAQATALQVRIRTRAYFLWLNRTTNDWTDPDANWRAAERLERSVGAG